MVVARLLLAVGVWIEERHDDLAAGVGEVTEVMPRLALRLRLEVNFEARPRSNARADARRRAPPRDRFCIEFDARCGLLPFCALYGASV
jgi:hypothetical protein